LILALAGTELADSFGFTSMVGCAAGLPSAGGALELSADWSEPFPLGIENSQYAASAASANRKSVFVFMVVR